jgi:HEAT repeat protein
MSRSIHRLLGLVFLAASSAAAEDRSGEVPGLLLSLKNDQANVRAGSARTLGEIGPAAKDAVPDLTAALRDGDRDVRQNAAQALGNIGTAAQPAAGELSAALRDSQWQVRRAAAYALGRLGTRDVEPALKAARKDKNDAVEKAAKTSLEQIKKLPKPKKKK